MRFIIHICYLKFLHSKIHNLSTALSLDVCFHIFNKYPFESLESTWEVSRRKTTILLAFPRLLPKNGQLQSRVTPTHFVSWNPYAHCIDSCVAARLVANGSTPRDRAQPLLPRGYLANRGRARSLLLTRSTDRSPDNCHITLVCPHINAADVDDDADDDSGDAGMLMMTRRDKSFRPGNRARGLGLSWINICTRRGIRTQAADNAWSWSHKQRSRSEETLDHLGGLKRVRSYFDSHRILFET